MNILLESIKAYWFFWLLVVVVLILQPFIPKIKGSFGEKSVAIILSMMDKRKYKVINDLMLKAGDRTSQIERWGIEDEKYERKD